MSANPPLEEGVECAVPIPFDGEWIGVARGGVEFTVDGIEPKSWNHTGAVFLSNLRLVLVNSKPDSDQTLRAVDLPLAFIEGASFNQPIFGCNNLTGKCWKVDAGFGAGTPVQWRIDFKHGGVGTFLPLFHRYRKAAAEAAEREAAEAAAAAEAGQGSPAPRHASAPPIPSFLGTALVDPNDPTVVYLTGQPTSSRRDDAFPHLSVSHGIPATAAGSSPERSSGSTLLGIARSSGSQVMRVFGAGSPRNPAQATRPPLGTSPLASPPKPSII